MKQPEKYLSKIKGATALAESNLMNLKTINKLIGQVPDNIPDDTVSISIVNTYYNQGKSEAHASWTEKVLNPNFDTEIRTYNEHIKVYEEELKAFDAYNKRKAAGETEALEDEVARLEHRLAAKKAELEKRASK
jgi:hypothetical protein